MKRVLALLAAFTVAFVLTACRNEVENSSLTSETTASGQNSDIGESSMISNGQGHDVDEESDFVPITSSEEYFESKVYFEHSKLALVHYLFHEPIRDTDGSYPLIIFLHGLGDSVNEWSLGTATQFAESLMLLENESEKYSAYTLVPQTPFANEGWWTDEQLEAFQYLIYDLIENYSIDTKRIYITGISMGGSTTCVLVDTMPPDTFAAAVPLSGAETLTNPGALHSTAFRIYHSKNDTVVHPEYSRALYKQLSSSGHPNMEYIEFEYGSHISPLYSVYTEQRYPFFDWLFAQRLP